MSTVPIAVNLELYPQRRFDVIDISQKVVEKVGDIIDKYPKAIYCSYHTTAGYLEQSICSKLQYSKTKIISYIKAYQDIFPMNADYIHDKMDLRDELSQDQRKTEPKNADSHLTFISSGLKNCTTYFNNPEQPVYFIELDGVSEFGKRKRQTSALYYYTEEPVYEHTESIPISNHHIDAISLRDPNLGYLEKLNEKLKAYDIEQGMVEISLDPEEKHAGLTVNEYETLLMQHDLTKVLKNPRKFMTEKGRYILKHPKLIPSRTKEYAMYDFIHLFNETMDSLKINGSKAEKLLSKFIAVPAERILRMRRSINLLVKKNEEDDNWRIVQGQYQSPILVQWKKSSKNIRNLRITITRFK
jgi:thiamine phosphate synthase YjbQ (UPF0047 family)